MSKGLVLIIIGSCNIRYLAIGMELAVIEGKSNMEGMNMEQHKIHSLQSVIDQVGKRLIMLSGELLTGNKETIDFFGDRWNRNTFKYDVKLTIQKLEHFIAVLDQVNRYRT